MKWRATVAGVFILLAASPVWAVQSHGGAEGLVSHQVSHILFTVGMGYLLYRLSRTELKGPGWREFKTFLWLILAWNLLTFSGHWMNEFIATDKFVKAAGATVSFSATGLSDALYYLTRLDHLLLVPSFLFLLLALRKWSAKG
jgi:hypothetical protein